MLEKRDLEALLDEGLKTGATYSEIFMEEKEERSIRFFDCQMKDVDSRYTKGCGLRLQKENDTFYASVPGCLKSVLFSSMQKLARIFDSEQVVHCRELSPLQKEDVSIPKRRDAFIKTLLMKLDRRARTNRFVYQVAFHFYTRKQKVHIASSLGTHVEENRYIERLTMTIYVKDEMKSASFMETIGEREIDLQDEAKLFSLLDRAVELACCNLHATSSPGGVMSVVIANGFGGVLFHEAAGHAVEATLAKDHLSVLSDRLGEMVASPLVTLIDDGTIDGAFGTTKFDDEGCATRRNVLIENGVLTNYLVDFESEGKMHCSRNGCARRESFHYAPTSRMNNTYLAKGTSSLSSMIESVDYGLYCISMPGGQVIPSTGDFNFGVSCARMIRHGKLAEYVRGVSLIGNIKDVLYNIEMVGDDLDIKTGYCGSVSGTIPVCIGMPSVKVAKMTVGGDLVS